MGAGNLCHRQFAQQVDLYTGGLNLTPHICSHHSNDLGYEQVYTACSKWYYNLFYQYVFLHHGISMYRFVMKFLWASTYILSFFLTLVVHVLECTFNARNRQYVYLWNYVSFIIVMVLVLLQLQMTVFRPGPDSLFMQVFFQLVIIQVLSCLF